MHAWQKINEVCFFDLICFLYACFIWTLFDPFVWYKLSEGGRFRHNRVTSQINFRGSAEGTTILDGSGGPIYKM